MTDRDPPFAPHETRMLALEMAVEAAKIPRSKYADAPSDASIIITARRFEAYLTEPPLPGFETDGEVE